MMKQATLSSLVLALALGATGLAAHAQSKGKADPGKREFEARCASCHGVNAKGNGPYTQYLKAPAPDLTGLAKRNGGVFPVQQVYDVIEGGGAGHGPREMPVWGRVFTREASDIYVDVPYDAEPVVRARILALTDYLSRLQSR